MNVKHVYTRLYYYGARYYDPRTSVFLGVDPKADKYPSWAPNNYTLDNPVILVDPDGKGPGGPPLSQFFSNPQINSTSVALPKIALATVSHAFSGPLLVTSAIVMPIAGNVTQGINGGEYPSWATPYSLKSDCSLQDRPNMLENVSWEDGKELMGSLLGVIFPPIGGESTGGKIADAAIKEILPEIVKNIPPNKEKSENTAQEQGQRDASAKKSSTDKQTQVKLIPDSWGTN